VFLPRHNNLSPQERSFWRLRGHKFTALGLPLANAEIRALLPLPPNLADQI
jgi:hypothetical protein